MKRSRLLEAALKYRRAGLSIIPTNSNKVAALEEWKPYQQEIAVLDEAEDWFNNNHRNIAVVAGAVSGHAEIIDVDPKKERPNVWEQYTELVEEEAPGLLSKLIIEKSPKGYHLGYRCPEITIPGNKPLARFLRENIEGKDEIKTLIETRGEGGYCVVTPSAGYNLVQGSFEHISEISKLERDVLIRCAMELNEYIDPQKVVNGPKQPARSNSGLLPGDDFNERGDLVALLEEHGWCFVGNRGEYQRWRRPGKDKGHSASTINNNVFYVFSSNAHPFEPYTSYSPFAVYTLLKHGGDYSAAARELASRGYGDQNKVVELRPDQKTKGAKPLNLDDLSDCFEQEIEMLWRNRIPKGMPIIVNGREGHGKTTICAQAAKAILEANRNGVVGWIASEGFVKDTYTKLEILNLDRKRFVILQNTDGTFTFNFNQPAQRNQLDAALQRYQQANIPILAVVVDSIRGISPFDDNDSKIKNVMMPLNSIVCDKYGASLIYIDHHKKGQSKNLLDKSVGTTAKTAAVRAVYSVLKAGEYVRKIVLAKTNLFDHQVGELMAALSDTGLTLYESSEKSGATLRGEAQRWLIKMFANETMYRTNKIIALGGEQGFTEPTLQKAKKELGIDSLRDENGWFWFSDAFLV
jgi:archaellum biogenesis ATPase FlaH